MLSTPGVAGVRGAGRRLRQLAQAEGRLDRGAAGRLRASPAAARCRGTSRRAASPRSPRRPRWPSTAPTSAELGIEQLGDRAEVNNMEVTVNAVTHGIRSFTTLPYVFTTLATARTLLDASPDQSSYTLVNVAAGSDDREPCARPWRARLPDAEILTHARVPQAQPRLLAVRDRRRRRPDRRRGCSASSSASSSSPRRSTPAPRTT